MSTVKNKIVNDKIVNNFKKFQTRKMKRNELKLKKEKS